MGALDFYVDKMHFKGHTSKRCHELYNPYSCKDLSNVNTQVCEQTFRWTNGYKQVKSMNQFRFRLFFTYLIDLHNLKISDQLQITHPLSKHTSIQDNVLVTAFEDLNIKKCTDPAKDIAETDTVEDAKSTITCPICGKNNFGQKNPKSGLTRHLNSVHKGEDIPKAEGIKCPHCNKICKNASGLSRHKNYKHNDCQV